MSQILELIYWTITIFSFDHMTDENRELHYLPYISMHDRNLELII